MLPTNMNSIGKRRLKLAYTQNDRNSASPPFDGLIVVASAAKGCLWLRYTPMLPGRGHCKGRVCKGHFLRLAELLAILHGLRPCYHHTEGCCLLCTMFQFGYSYILDPIQLIMVVGSLREMQRNRSRVRSNSSRNEGKGKSMPPVRLRRSGGIDFVSTPF